MNPVRNYPPASQKGAPGDRNRRKKEAGFVMATLASSSRVADNQYREPGLLADIGAFWRQFFAKAFDPYRPELHYMRGPGPACRAKQMALSPAVRSMVVEIRAAKALRSAARS
jgi:hypothetical protein